MSKTVEENGKKLSLGVRCSEEPILPATLGNCQQMGCLEGEQERGELGPKKQALTNPCRVPKAKTLSLSNNIKTTCLQAIERVELALPIMPQGRITSTFRAFNSWSGWNSHSAQFPGLG